MRKISKLALSSIVLGVISAVLFFIIVPAIIIAPLGLILGLIAMKNDSSKKYAKAGIAINVIVLVLLALLWYGLSLVDFGW